MPQPQRLEDGAGTPGLRLLLLRVQGLHHLTERGAVQGRQRQEEGVQGLNRHLARKLQPVPLAAGPTPLSMPSWP